MLLINGEALEEMAKMPENSIDAVICDPPYGTTKCHWDSVIDIEKMFDAIHRVLKPGGACILFSQNPFAAKLIVKNLKEFRHEIIWEKPHGVGFLNANRAPLRAHELILVFCLKSPVYNPQKTPGKPYRIKRATEPAQYGRCERIDTTENTTGERYPIDVLKIKPDKVKLHPTQKPVELCEWLVKTYTNPGDVILDFCMGSGSTGKAALNCGRDFIGIELNEEIYEIARNRLLTK